MRKNKINKDEIDANIENILEDRKLIPNYRYNITVDQKKALSELVGKICSVYGIARKIPDFKGQTPEVIAGDFSGIVAPFHFSSTDSTFLTMATEEIKTILGI